MPSALLSRRPFRLLPVPSCPRCLEEIGRRWVRAPPAGTAFPASRQGLAAQGFAVQGFGAQGLAPQAFAAHGLASHGLPAHDAAAHPLSAALAPAWSAITAPAGSLAESSAFEHAAVAIDNPPITASIDASLIFVTGPSFLVRTPRVSPAQALATMIETRLPLAQRPVKTVLQRRSCEEFARPSSIVTRTRRFFGHSHVSQWAEVRRSGKMSDRHGTIAQAAVTKPPADTNQQSGNRVPDANASERDGSRIRSLRKCRNSD
jgi:hypothetical protein